jgi:phosphatidylglycerophosphatase A
MIANNIVKFLASGFYSSYGRLPYPGSRGTIPIWLIAFFIVGGNQAAIAILAILLTCFSVFLSGRAETIWGHDAKKIVIDEWAGMMVTLILVPYTLLNYVIAFIIFRLTDAIKIFPARTAEKLPRGWGVTADDIVAGIQSCLLTHLVIYIINQYIIN